MKTAVLLVWLQVDLSSSDDHLDAEALLEPEPWWLFLFHPLMDVIHARVRKGVKRETNR